MTVEPLPLQLTIAAYTPLIQGGDLVTDELAGWVTQYGHTANVSEGYKTASMSFNADWPAVVDWLQYGLMRHIETHSPALEKVWEGFVNAVTVSVGPVTVKVGPLLEIGNRVAVVFQTRSYNTNPPIPGYRTRTAAADNAQSQAAYGILEEYLTGGTGDFTEMEGLRDTYLAEYAWPDSDQTLSLPGRTGMQVSLEMVGYAALLTRYSFQDNTTTGQVNASTKVTSVLDGDPNSRFDTSGVEVNTHQVDARQEEETHANEVIKNIVSRGDDSDYRWIFGIYNERRAEYRQVDHTDYQYEFRVSDAGVNLQPKGDPDTVVHPWEVRPGEWVFLADFPEPGVPVNDQRADPRFIFIETVTFKAPYSIQINGGKVRTVEQKLAKLGLGGR